jgi:hypothetical protein
MFQFGECPISKFDIPNCPNFYNLNYCFTSLNPFEYKLLSSSKRIECFNPEHIFEILNLFKLDSYFGELKKYL